MIKKFFNGLVWGLGFFGAALLLAVVHELMTPVFQSDFKRVEVKEITLHSMNLDLLKNRMALAGEFSAKLNKKYNSYSINVDLYIEGKIFVSKCYGNPTVADINSGNKFNIIIYCDPYSKPEKIDNVIVKLYADEKV